MYINEEEEKQLIEKFKNYDISTQHFSLNGVETYGRLVDIYDGDTVKIILPIINNYYKFDIRLKGIDTCEIKSHNIENKNKGLKARKRICQLVEQLWGNYASNPYDFETKKSIQNYLKEVVCIVFIKCYEFDKYGRLLADVYINYNDINSKSISEILLNENLAYKYDGGKKLSEDEQNDIIME
jgi:endonuclease YncB( thermonuclease family)